MLTRDGRTVIPHHEQAATHQHIDGPLIQIGWQGQTGTIYSLGEDFAHLEPGGFSPIYAPWGETCGHQIKAADEAPIKLEDPGEVKPRVWECKVGGLTGLPHNADGPMREAVEHAYREMTGKDPEFTFSGWGAHLTEGERAVVEDRLPDLRKVLAEIDDAIEMRESTLAYLSTQNKEA